MGITGKLNGLVCAKVKREAGGGRLKFETGDGDCFRGIGAVEKFEAGWSSCTAFRVGRWQRSKAGLLAAGAELSERSCCVGRCGAS